MLREHLFSILMACELLWEMERDIGLLRDPDGLVGVWHWGLSPSSLTATVYSRVNCRATLIALIGIA